MTTVSPQWKRLLAGAVAFGVLLAGGLAALLLSLPFPVIDLLDLHFLPSLAWLPWLLLVSLLVGVSAFVLLRQWQQRSKPHDLAAAFLLPVLVSALATWLLVQSADAHSNRMALATPQLTIDSIERLDKGYLSGRLSTGQYVQSCRYYRRWLLLETGRVHECRFPDSEAPIESSMSVREFEAAYQLVSEALDVQAGRLRVAAGLPWLAWGVGLLLAFVTRRRAVSGSVDGHVS